MTTADALLAAVCADPHADVPRLACADWLDEHGDGARAEFIRVQLELAKGYPETGCQNFPCFPPYCLHCRPLRRRERALLEAHGYGWVPRAGLPERAHHGLTSPQTISVQGAGWRAAYEFRRGFVEAVTCPCAAWLANGPALVRAAPVTEVRLSDRRPSFWIMRLMNGGEWTWWNEALTSPDHDTLPALLWDALPQGADPIYETGKNYPAEPAALAALSRVAVAWARAAAGLPALAALGLQES